MARHAEVPPKVLGLAYRDTRAVREGANEPEQKFQTRETSELRIF